MPHVLAFYIWGEVKDLMLPAAFSELRKLLLALNKE